MKNKKLIDSRFGIDDTVYYIMDCRILDKEIIGVKAATVKELGDILEEIQYKINICSNNGWVRPDELFKTKVEAGEYLLSLSGLSVSLTEVG